MSSKKSELPSHLNILSRIPKMKDVDVKKSSAPLYWQSTAKLAMEKEKEKTPKAHTGGLVSKTRTYVLKKGEMVVPTERVRAVKKAMSKANLKPIKNKI